MDWMQKKIALPNVAKACGNRRLFVGKAPRKRRRPGQIDALRGRNGKIAPSLPLKKQTHAHSNVVKQRVRRSIVVKIDMGRALFELFDDGVRQRQHDADGTRHFTRLLRQRAKADIRGTQFQSQRPDRLLAFQTRQANPLPFR